MAGRWVKEWEETGEIPCWKCVASSGIRRGGWLCQIMTNLAIRLRAAEGVAVDGGVCGKHLKEDVVARPGLPLAELAALATCAVGVWYVWYSGERGCAQTTYGVCNSAFKDDTAVLEYLLILAPIVPGSLFPERGLSRCLLAAMLVTGTNLATPTLNDSSPFSGVRWLASLWAATIRRKSGDGLQTSSMRHGRVKGKWLRIRACHV